MKSIKYLFFLFVAVAISAQTFNYERVWGTYLGGVDTRPLQFYENNQQQVIIDGIAGSTYPSATASYYNQFITSGSQGFQSNINALNTNNFTAIINPTASLQKFEYRTVKKIIHREKNGNYFAMANTGTPTPGAWLSNPVEPANNANVRNMMLEKYSDDGILLWRTYVPNLPYNEESYPKSIATDTSGNIYICGQTLWQTLADAGTAFSTFTTVNTPGNTNLTNVYVAKLNAQGQKIWATYLPAFGPAMLSVYDNALYVAANSDINANQSLLATQGSYQQTKAYMSVTKLNTADGTRQWGTYYGDPVIQNNSPQSIVASSDGVYLLGGIFNLLGSTNGYFASTGAFQSQSMGGESDLFIVKFDPESGNRVWGTYYGTPGDDLPVFGAFSNIDVRQGKILIANVHNGSASFSTPGAFVSTKPNNQSVYDLVFSMFDAVTGGRIFASYYGSIQPNPNSAYAGLSGKFSDTGDSFYLYGYTSSQAGYTESNAFQPNIIFPAGVTNGMTGFLAKFSSKTLGTSETASADDLQLFDNPNNGNFSIQGKILEKEKCSFKLYDSTGRFITQENMKRQNRQSFNYQGKLPAGHYIISVINAKNNIEKSFKMMVR
jgi:hypothetical protein